MNPLFISHLAADFLLQPKWLADMKEKRVFGLVIHMLIHALTLAVFISPIEPIFFLALILIAAIHGIVDRLKIQYQKTRKTFEPAFLIDQLTHLLVLVAANAILKFPVRPLWHSESGQGMIMLIAIFSFAAMLFNLFKIENYPLKTKKQELKRALLITAVFLMYLTPAMLF